MKLGIHQFIDNPSDFDCWLLVWGMAIIVLGSLALFVRYLN